MRFVLSGRHAQGILWSHSKVRLAKWFVTIPAKQKTKIVKDVTQLVLARRTRMCNFLEYKGPPVLLLAVCLLKRVLGEQTRKSSIGDMLVCSL